MIRSSFCAVCECGKRRLWIVAATALLICLICVPTIAEDFAGLERIEVSPEEMILSGPRSSSQMVVTGYFAGGELRDLTHQATYRATADGPMTTLQAGLVTPAKDGIGAIEVVCGTQTLSVAVRVQDFALPQPVSFRRETLAVLTKQGCNSGSCHGKPNGRGALELSLNAFDPQLDERSLIRGPLLRFTHPLDPDESLLLKKPMLRLPHGGGKRLKPDDAAHDVLRQWIAEGCRLDAKESPKYVRLEVFPSAARVLKLSPVGGKAMAAQQQVRVVAIDSDGTRRDVTRIASFTVSHDRIASIDENGLVTGRDRGQAAVVVRYLDDIVSTYFTFVRDVPEFKWNDPAEHNNIDLFVHQKLKQLQYLPSETCDDATFIRRVSLDVRGLLPTLDETTAFVADPSPTRRAVLIDRYLDSPEYAGFWGLRLADLLRISKDKLSPDRAAAYSRWVAQSLARNEPYDQFVSALLTSSGDTDDHPAANFFRTTSDTKTVTETVAQLFMGSRVMCAQCHNHPYESWTQDNYYQIAAAFHEVERKVIPSDPKQEPSKGKKKRKKGDTKDEEMVIDLSPGRTMSNPRTGVVQKPWPTDVIREQDEDKRRGFARWLTARENPFFARVAANRMWAALFGRGLVEPIDDFRSSNPSVNVELLDTLAQEFADSGFDRKSLLRKILNSRTYQLSSETNRFNESDDLLNSHFRTRLLTAEQMQDAVRRLCDGPERLLELQTELKVAEANLQSVIAEHPDEQSAPVVEATRKRDEARTRGDSYYMTQQPYPYLTSFLTAFGQPPRETACACERREEANLDQALQMMNSELIRGQVAHAAGRFERQKKSNEDLIRDLYLAAFSRLPREVEVTKLTAHLANSSNRQQSIEDVIWALMNTNEFMFQH